MKTAKEARVLTNEVVKVLEIERLNIIKTYIQSIEATIDNCINKGHYKCEVYINKDYEKELKKFFIENGYKWNLNGKDEDTNNPIIKLSWCGMARENFVLKTLLETGTITWSPKGNSMTPRIESGDEVVVEKVDHKTIKVGDIVYAKVKGSYYLHLVSAIDETKNRFQISNNHGLINGWTSEENVFGKCIKVKDKNI